MKNNQISTGYVSVNSALMQAHSPEIIRKNSADLFAKFNGKHYVCNAFHNDRRGKLAKLAGIFYARSHRFHTPLQCVNAPAAGHGGMQRVGMKPFYSYACLTF